MKLIRFLSLLLVGGLLLTGCTTQPAAEFATPETATPETATPETATPETATPETASPETALTEEAEQEQFANLFQRIALLFGLGG